MLKSFSICLMLCFSLFLNGCASQTGTTSQVNIEEELAIISASKDGDKRKSKSFLKMVQM